MMNYIIAAIAAASFISALITGNMASLSASVFSGAKNAVNISLTLLGTMCLWNGISRLAEDSGLYEKIRRLLFPVIRLLFPVYSKTPAGRAISANITANLMGLGNAATPLGIEAMRRMKEASGNNYADREQIRFVVINSAALTIIPATVSSLRAEFGSEKPFSVIVPVWLTGICALIAGLTVEKIFSGMRKK